MTTKTATIETQTETMTTKTEAIGMTTKTETEAMTTETMFTKIDAIDTMTMRLLWNLSHMKWRFLWLMTKQLPFFFTNLTIQEKLKIGANAYQVK